MLIQALCDYYEVLKRQGKINPEEYSNVDIKYVVSLTADGKIDGIVDCRDTSTVMKGKKEKEVLIPKTMVLPKRTEKSAIDSNIVEHRPAYIFGLNYDEKTGGLTAEDEKNKARKSHAAFKEATEKFFVGMNDDICKAYYNFAKTWCPENETGNVYLMSLGKELSKSGFAFCLSGHPEMLLHESLEMKKKWEPYYANKNDGPVAVAQCGILGDELPIARLHDKIKSVPGGSTMGNSLISFNNQAEGSYGKEQSLNSNISETAMKYYTQALNFLFANKKHVTVLGDMTVLHWAASGDERCDDILNMFAFSDQLSSDDADEAIKSLWNNVRNGRLMLNVDDFLKDLDPSVNIYIVGIMPNSARLSVKFIYRQRFGKLIENVMRHQADLRICGNDKQITINDIQRELVSPKSKKQKVDSASTVKLLESIMNGYPYPAFLLQTAVRRVRTDRDDKNQYIQMNDTRMGIIKACINRTNRAMGKKEEITMALDKTNNNPAYLCGRLFFVLESIQQKASGFSLNRTIKDSYFSAASSRPALIFPKLLTLSQHHMRKLNNSGYQNDEIGAILDAMGPEFPDTLSLKEQGTFMLGYYQQKEETVRKIKEYKEANLNNNKEINA